MREMESNSAMNNATKGMMEKERQKKADAQSNLEKLHKQFAEFEG